MEKLNSISNERVCDLVDGRVPDKECVKAFETLLSDHQAAQTWHTYHVIGDVLRSAELAPTSSGHDFLERLERRLALEPMRLVAIQKAQPIVVQLDLPSANASIFRWKMLAGVASFALVGVIGLGIWTQTGQAGDEQIAAQSVVAPGGQTPALAVADTDVGTMLRDARLDELMAAHRQLGGHSALQVPASFLHTATYEGSAR